MDQQKTTADAVFQAAEAWKKAPVHIRGMAGAYVNPLMQAVLCINQQLQVQHDAIDEAVRLIMAGKSDKLDRVLEKLAGEE